MLLSNSLQQLKDKKNLLAFSGGVDSTALFFLLQDSKIKFDIAIVNYGVREQSTLEVKYAQDLASTYECKFHLLNAPKIDTNFEANARQIRYNFFEKITSEFNYDNLLTAHHLGDRFEWMLMQFCKGAGCAELSSMTTMQERINYCLIRPLLHLDKTELQSYLDEKNIKYFIDESNFDEDIKRNYFRHTHTQPLLQKHLNGIKKSFEYIDIDAKELISEVDIHKINDFTYFKSTKDIRSDIYAIDKFLKSVGIVISAKERELLKKEVGTVVARKYIVSWHLDFVFIAPYTSTKTSMQHDFKERMRLLKIEPKLRNYFFENLDVFESLESSVPLQ